MREPACNSLRLSESDAGDRRSDYAIIQRVLKGEKEEFRHLIDRYKDSVFSTIMRQVDSRSLAEELSQETFIKAYVNIRKFRFESAFSTWLYTIALNHTNSYFSSRRGKEAKQTESLELVSHDGSRNEVGAPNGNHDIVQEFRAALVELKPIFREVVVVCALEGKTYEEAATILKVPVGTIRSRLSKARLLLKKQFEMNGNGAVKHGT